jgi:hypothetical protein
MLFFTIACFKKVFGVSAVIKGKAERQHYRIKFFAFSPFKL